MKKFAYTTHYKTLPGDLHTPVSTYLKVRDLFRGRSHKCDLGCNTDHKVLYR